MESKSQVTQSPAPIARTKPKPLTAIAARKAKQAEDRKHLEWINGKNVTLPGTVERCKQSAIRVGIDNAIDAEDIAQSAFLKEWEAIQEGDASKYQAALKAHREANELCPVEYAGPYNEADPRLQWEWRVRSRAKGLARNLYARRKFERQRFNSDASLALLPIQSEPSIDHAAKVRALLASLSPEDQSLLTRVYFLGETQETIATEIKVSVRTIKRRLKAIRDSIQLKAKQATTVSRAARPKELRTGIAFDRFIGSRVNKRRKRR